MRPGLQAQESYVLLIAVVAAAAIGTLGCDGDAADAAQAHGETTLLPAELALPAPRIAHASMAGSGCTDPSTIYISARRNTFFAEFDGFIVTTSAQVRDGDAECTVSLTLNAPDGVAYAPAGMNVALTTDATSDVTLTSSGAWSPWDTSTPTPTRLSTRGRRANSKVLDEPNLWSSCSGPRTLQVKTQLHIRGALGRSGYASVHELSNLQFRAKRCEADSGPLLDAGPVTPMASDAPRIDHVGLLGSGCSGTNAAEVVWSDDRRSFELLFRGFTAEGPSQIKNCTASIELTSPPSHRATIDSYVLEGRSQLPAGATATLDSSYWYPGDFSISAQENSQVFTYVGPREGAFVANARFASGDVTFGDCGQNRITFSLDAMVGSLDGASALVEVQRLHSLKLKLQACR